LQEQAEQQDAALEPEPEPEPAPTAGIGETVTAGDVSWQVTNARQATQLTSEFMEPKQGNFVVVDFAFTNNGTEPVTLDGESLSLIDGEGRTFKTDPDTFGYIDPAKDIFLDQVNPGVAQQGEVIFTVAPDASDFTLEAGDTAIFSDEVGRIDRRTAATQLPRRQALGRSVNSSRVRSQALRDLAPAVKLPTSPPLRGAPHPREPGSSSPRPRWRAVSSCRP
jgi:hypothetical protein